MTRPFKDLGFDSLTAVELRNAINRTTGADLSAAAVFDHPTCEALAEHLHDLLWGAGGTSAEELSERLDELEGLVGEVSLTEVERKALARRLNRVVDGLSASGGETPVTDQLNNASDDELFAFIRDQFGPK